MEDKMRRTSRVWKQVAIVAFLGLGSGIGYAQDAAAPAMTAERSWQIQNILQSIDGDRESWVNLLVSKWASVLNPAVYDAAAALGPVARIAPAWQVYGALQASDFMTASQILRGTRKAGPYIATSSGANPAQFELSPQTLGDPFSDLVYQVVSPPCRVVDTRNPGARTGVLMPNVERTFDLGADAETDGQGGGPFAPGCGALPTSHPIGWAINVTVVGNLPYTAHGVLKMWPFTGPEPIASVINWMPNQNGAIANGLTVTGCPGCADSITVKTLGSDPTHLIIDVMGYYTGATLNSSTASTVTRLAGPATGAVPNNTGATATGAACPAGTSLIGGDLEHAPPAVANVSVGASGQASATTWAFQVWNNSGGNVNFTAFSRCVDTPVKFN
jgi:hypothetical protein